MSDLPLGGAMPFLEHIRELRKRVIVSVLALAIATLMGFFLYEEYAPILFSPLGKDLDSFTFHTLQEPFIMMLRVSLYFGIAVSFPVHLYNIIAFLMPAMTTRERKMGAFLLPFSTVLAISGAAMAYFYVVPWAVAFMQSTAFNPFDVKAVNKMDEALKMIIKTVTAFMVLLQTPLLLIILMALNIVSRRALLKASRYAIVGIFILAAVVTPPDLLSQLALAFPLIVLYFLAILIAKLFGFGQSPDAAGHEP